jgi:glutamine phosphoribosylpyrophosphate amidotransferase
MELLQHRGREGAGIMAIGDTIDVYKWHGPVSRVDLDDLYEVLPAEQYHTFAGHVRYATKGREEQILEDCHPHTIGGEVIHKGNHILVLNCDMAIVCNGQIEDKYFDSIDKKCLSTECDTEAQLHLYKRYGAAGLIENVPGAFTAAIADSRLKDVIVLRDRTGIKPGFLGKKERGYCFSSEDRAIVDNGGEFVEDMEPGSVYYLSPGENREPRKQKVLDPTPRYCFFEWNYLAHVKSILNCLSVRVVRQRLGEMIAKHIAKDVELITYLPRCPKTAAKSCANKAGRKFAQIFYKMRGERAFQGSNADDRKNSIDKNLHLLTSARKRVRGRIVGSIDDSTIRGNNSKRERYLIYEEGGVKKCYHINYTPKIGSIGDDGVPRGCMFGVDMPPDDDFIVRGNKDGELYNRTDEEINEAMQMPTIFPSLESMLEVYEKLGVPRDNLCYYCCGGPHPFNGL